MQPEGVFYHMDVQPVLMESRCGSFEFMSKVYMRDYFGRKGAWLQLCFNCFSLKLSIRHRLSEIWFEFLIVYISVYKVDLYGSLRVSLCLTEHKQLTSLTITNYTCLFCWYDMNNIKIWCCGTKRGWSLCHIILAKSSWRDEESHYRILNTEYQIYLIIINILHYHVNYCLNTQNGI